MAQISPSFPNEYLLSNQITLRHFLDLRNVYLIFHHLSIAIFTFVAAILLFRVFFSPLARIPGPRLAGLSGLWRTYYYAKGRWHEDVLKLHQKYGRVVRIAPNEVSVVDATAMKQLFGHGKSARKTKWYDVWQVPGLPSAFFAETEPSLHSKLRKRVSSAYSISAILKFEVYIQGCLDLCFAKLKKHADLGNVIDMTDWTGALAFDIVGELAFGEQFGQLRTESDHINLRSNIAISFLTAANLGHAWGQMRIVNNIAMTTLLQLFSSENHTAELLEWVNERLQSRKLGLDGSTREDMLSHFIRMKSIEGTEIASDGEILVEAMSIVGAGADTTSIGMRACLYYLVSNPDIYRRLQKSIDEFCERNNIADKAITYTQTQQIPLLSAVVKESLRLLPSIVFQLLRYSPPGGITIRGHYIPAGYEIGISPLAQNRDTEVYGEDSHEFRPDRWLEDESQLSLLEVNNMTFGGNGPRTCAGRHIAMVEINKFIAQLLRNFNVAFANKEEPWRIHTFWFAHQKNMKMHITVRKDVSCERLVALQEQLGTPNEGI